MLQILAGVLLVSGTAAWIIQDRRRLQKKNAIQEPSTSNADTSSEKRQALTEFQKGQGRGGPGGS